MVFKKVHFTARGGRSQRELKLWEERASLGERAGQGAVHLRGGHREMAWKQTDGGDLGACTTDQGRTDGQQNQNIQQRPPCGFSKDRTGLFGKNVAVSYPENPQSRWNTATEGQTLAGETMSHPILFPGCRPRGGLDSDHW